MAIRFHADTRCFFLHAQNATYAMLIDENDHMLHMHWGAPLLDCDLRPLLDSYTDGSSNDIRPAQMPFEIPTRAGCYFGTPAVGIQQAAGDTVVELKYESHVIIPGKPKLNGLPATYVDQPDDAETLVVTLRDPLTALRVEEMYTVFANRGAIARSQRIVNDGSAACAITHSMTSVQLWGNDYDVVHLRGMWTRERHVQRNPLGMGTFRIESVRGASGHTDNPFLMLVRPSTTEFAGEAWAMNHVYSGSFCAQAEVTSFGHTRMMMGMNGEVFRWQLEPGEEFQAPECILAYSAQGMNALSQQLHALYRQNLCRGEWRDKDRPILINNWEATYFSFTEEKLLDIARAAAEIGVELFVLDDGWFGHRDLDNSSLGDWFVDRRKLPNGLGGVAGKINDLGLKFGLWFEPEMVSPDSELYRAHPDWCLHVDDRPRTEARQQLILDLSRTEVQDYIIESVSSVLRSAPIEYVKWDMNRNMSEAFSNRPAAQQLETQHRYMLGLYRVMEVITSAFPQVLFEGCASGGGRFDPGMLYYMPQIWTSDDTDPVERLKIQYGTSLAYPAATMGAHVSASPNHQTGRVTGIQMRGDVAIGGNFGFELDLSRQTPEDLETARSLIKRVKKLRTLTRTGVFTRLVSPFEENFAAWQFADEDRNELLVCFYQRLALPNGVPYRLKINCDASATYEDENGQRHPGSLLMHIGLPMQLRSGDFTSTVLHLKKV